MCSAVVQQFYQSEVNNEYVIGGNSAVLKCSIPSFVADFVSVTSWEDSQGHSYSPKDSQNGNQKRHGLGSNPSLSTGRS